MPALEPEGLAEREPSPRVLESDLVDLVEVGLDPEVDLIVDLDREII